jgi:hypothetical protein
MRALPSEPWIWACTIAAWRCFFPASNTAEQDFKISGAEYEAASTGSAIAYKGLAMVTGTHGARWSCKFDLFTTRSRQHARSCARHLPWNAGWKITACQASLSSGELTSASLVPLDRSLRYS